MRLTLRLKIWILTGSEGKDLKGQLQLPQSTGACVCALTLLVTDGEDTPSEFSGNDRATAKDAGIRALCGLDCLV